MMNSAKMFGRLDSLASSGNSLMSVDVAAGRRLAIATGISYLACAFIALSVNMMAYADGGYFVFVLMLNDAWDLKWSAISARFTVYLLSAAPSEYLVQLFKLSPIQATVVNGYFFYILPFIQFSVASLIVWRRNSIDLIYICLQFALLICLSFGFPSEIFLAPGFLWVCLYSTRNNNSNFVFYISFFLLVFCHELALFASLVVVYDRYCQHISRFRPLVQIPHLAFIAATYALFLWFILWGGGTAGSQSNFLYILDPRLLPANPMLWILAAAALALFHWRRQLSEGLGRQAAFVIFFAACPLLLYYFLHVNFELGRYSARTITAGLMLLLSLLYVCKTKQPDQQSPRRELPLLIYASLGIGITSLFCFALVWKDTNNTINKMVVSSPGVEKVGDIDYRNVLAHLTPGERQYFDNDPFYWTLPYRAIVVRNGDFAGRSIPHYEIRSYDEYLAYMKICKSMRGSEASTMNLPPETFAAFRDYACSRPPGQKPLPVSVRARNALKRYLGYLGF